jgi:hypothetical protein
MKSTSTFIIRALAVTGLAFITSASVAACTGDDAFTNPPVNPVDSGTPDTSPKPDTGVADTGTDTGVVNPAPPVLGAQIDRFGRPAVNTALNATFLDADAVAATKKDAYNADKNVASWKTTYAPEIAKNLAILDSLDANCGNQLAAKAGAPAADTYDALAGVLADDRMYMDTSRAACTQYLAVEGNATTLIPNTDCGGRKLGYDVIETTYSALAIGKLVGVDDTIKADAAKTGGTTFPYLAAPLAP